MGGKDLGVAGSCCLRPSQSAGFPQGERDKRVGRRRRLLVA